MRRAAALHLVAPVLLAAAVLVTFWPVLDNGFVNFDDDRYVTDNPLVQRGFDAGTLTWAWTTGYEANWFPLTWMSHMLDWRLFGAAPAGHHATNLLLHTANMLLLFCLLVRLTGATWRSALVAALFGLHPLRVESVAWVSERKDVLSTFFWLLTTHAWVSWVRRPSVGRYLLVALGLALGLMSKAMLVTLPATLLLLDWWPLRRAGTRPGAAWGLVREKLPLLPLVAASAIVTVVVQLRGGAVGTVATYPLVVRVGNAIIAYVTYLGMMVWPRGLAIIYPHPGSAPAGRVAAAALFLVVVTVVAFRLRAQRPYLLVGWLWYLGTLLPVIGLVQVGDQALADRYTYVPLIGIFVALAWALPPWPRLVAVPVGVALVALALATRTQAGVWRDSVSLFSHALVVEERSPVAHNNLAFALAARGDTDAAIAHFERALVLRPGYLTAQVELGNVLLAAGRIEEAMAQYGAALAAHPDSGHALTNLGAALARLGRIDEAIALHERALVREPGLAAVHNNLGTALAARGRTAEARAHFEQALALDPTNADGLNNLGNMFLAEHRFADGLAAIERAIAERPAFGTAHANRAAALFLLGRDAEAWGAVRDARAHGYEPPAELLRRLAERTPEPAS